MNRTPLRPVMFDVTTLVPQPHPRCLELTTDEHFERHEHAVRERVEAQRQRNAIPCAQDTLWAKAISKTGSILRSAGNAMQEIHLVSEAKLRQELHEHWQKELRTLFPPAFNTAIKSSVNVGLEPVKMVSSCRVMHSGVSVSVDLFLTIRHICIVNKEIQAVIPFENVVSIQRSLALPLFASTGTTSQASISGHCYFMPIPAEHVLCSAIQVYTTTGELIQLFDFHHFVVSALKLFSSSVKGRAIDRAYIWLDRLWRDVVTEIPRPGFQYQLYQTAY